MTAIMIYLGKPEGKGYTGVLKMLEVLLSKRCSAEEKLEILQKEYKIPMTEAIKKEVHTMCNLSQGVRAEGRAEGRAELKIEIAQKLLSRGCDLEMIADATDLTLAQVKALGKKKTSTRKVRQKKSA